MFCIEQRNTVLGRVQSDEDSGRAHQDPGVEHCRSAERQLLHRQRRHRRQFSQMVRTSD